MADKVFVPVYEQEGNKFFIIHPDFVADSEDGAMEIGWGSMFVECVLLGIRFTKTVKRIDPDNTPHVKASLGVSTVAIFEGPLFQEAL